MWTWEKKAWEQDMIIISCPYQESMQKGLFSSVFQEMNYINNCKNIEDTLRPEEIGIPDPLIS